MNKFTFKSSLKEIVKEVDRSSRQNVQDACKFARQEVKNVLNVKRRSEPDQPPGRLSGKLWKSIRYKVVKDYDGTYDGLIGSTDWKANILEFGTGSMKRRPFLLKTLDKISSILREIMSRKLVK